ncbi:hypothetical protein GBAR_LOCUS27658 [Geodia barretti]|uniref:Uncharacterized protein n=1 Tax=Geodia barretti TaxID=519541 RepID=A0AA35TLA0_GEOBA|nr:hypothetical protein GBAR_LOCUS27658 [Geodia barretti]
MAMRIFVKICCGNTATEPQTYAISCNPTASIESLKSQAFARWLENSSENSERNSDQFRLWLSGTPALLSDKDKIQNVLREGDFVILCPKDVPQTESDVCYNGGLPTYGPYP